MESRYLNTNEACRFLGISRAKLFRLKKEGRIPYIQVDRSLSFDKEDLIEFMEKYKKVGGK